MNEEFWPREEKGRDGGRGKGIGDEDRMYCPILVLSLRPTTAGLGLSTPHTPATRPLPGPTYCTRSGSQYDRCPIKYNT